MAEDPSEEIFPTLLEIQKRKYAEFVHGADNYVPEVILERPKRRLEAIEHIQDEISTLNQELVEKRDQILQKIRDSVFKIESDEGYLETAFEEYEKCYVIDTEKCNSLVEDEVERLRNEMRKAQEDADHLVEKMQEFLKQNHQIVQDFLKTSHQAVYNLSLPAHQRTLQSSDFQSQEDQEKAAATGRTEEDDMSDVDGAAWQPNLQFLSPLGVESAHKIQWPNIAQLQMLNLTQQIKLSAVEIAVSSNLYELKLSFTGDIKSEKICTNQTYAKDSSALRTFKIDP